MKLQSGFALISILILMQVSALLSLSVMSQGILAQKIVSDQRTKRQLLNEAERFIFELSFRLRQIPSACLIPRQAAQELQAFPRNWWLKHACFEETSLTQRYYVVEALGKDPCVQAAYYRLTVLLMKASDTRMKVMLQSTAAIQAPSSEHCDRRPHSVDWGPQSWQELI